MSPVPNTSEEELTIDSIEGLKSFSVYVEDAYQAFMEAANNGPAPVTQSVVNQIEAVYAEINALIARYIKILDWGGEMSVDQAQLLQTFYNQIIEAYDSLQSSHATSPRATVINQVETATFLLERGMRLLENFSEIQTTAINSPAIKAGKAAYDALQQNCTDAKIIFDAIEGGVETASLEDAAMMASTQAQGLIDIEKKFNELEKELSALFESGALEEMSVQSLPIRNKSNFLTRSKDTATVFSPYIKKVIAQPRYASFIKETFSVPSAFDAALQREVYRVEAPSRLDTLLGIKYSSAFIFLKDMTLAQVDAFDGSQQRETIRQILSEKNIQYEIYMNWISAIPYMESLTTTTDEMTFGELFVRSEVELMLRGAKR